VVFSMAPLFLQFDQGVVLGLTRLASLIFLGGK